MNIIHKYIIPLKKFWVLWLRQSISMLGSSMTGFAITIWAYETTGSALVLSISGLLIMVPKMIVGILAGPLIDRINKKTVMICSDIGAGICTLVLYLLLRSEALEIWHIYVLNIANSILNSFQAPASSVAVSAVVPKEHYVRVNGLQSFSDGVIQVLAPVFATTMLRIMGMEGVIIADFVTMAFACLTLIFFVKIPVTISDNSKEKVRNYFGELSKGFDTVKASCLLKKLMLFMVFINLVAGITYFNLLSPMILARTANDSRALALVNGAIGLGCITGGLLTIIAPTAKRKVKTMFLCATLSFLFGDILLAVGNTLSVWVIAGFLSSVFLPALNANESYFWRTIIPIELQGRAFSLKYAIQSGVIPIGLLLGGLLADYIFEPFMITPPHLLYTVLGNGKGMGMALMFLITGIIGTALSVAGFFSRSMQKAETEAVEDP